MFNAKTKNPLPQSQPQSIDGSKIHTMQDDLMGIEDVALSQSPLQTAQKQPISSGNEIVFNNLSDASFSQMPPASALQSQLSQQKNTQSVKPIQRMPVSDMNGVSFRKQPSADAVQQEPIQHPNISEYSQLPEQKPSSIVSTEPVAEKTEKMSVEGIEFQPVSLSANNSFQNGTSAIKTSPVVVTPKNRTIYALLAVFVLLCVGAGGAYYWIVRQNSDQSEYVIEDDGKATGEDLEETISADYTTTAINTLLINNDGSDITSVINEAVASVGELFQGDVFQFVFAKKNNPTSPLTMQEVMSLMHIQFSQDITNQMNDGVTWFLYNDVDGVKSGFSAKVLNVEVAKNLFKDEEPMLSQEVQNIFIRSITPVSTAFSDSLHRNYAIRYLNIDSLQSQSVDYTFRGDSLILGTSKMTIRAMLDKLDQGMAQIQIQEQAQVNAQNQNMQ